MRLVLFAPLLCACGGLIGDGNAAMNENTTTSYPTRDAQSPLGSTDAYVAIDDDAGASDASIDGQDYFGFIYFQNESEFGSSHFDAAFFSGPQQWLNYPGCQPSQIGPCTIHVCSNFVAQSHLNAGGLSLSGGPYAGLTAGYGVPNTDYTGGASAMFAKGDVLGVSATGGDVSAFATQRVVAPGPITLTSPSAPSSISTASDLVATWTGGEPGARVVIEAFSGNVTSKWVTCSFDATSGSGVVPQAALSVVRGEAGAAFMWGQRRDKMFLAGGTYPIQLSARQTTLVTVNYQ